MCIRDRRNLLRVVDNPMLDVALVSVMMSPVGAFSADDVTRIRLAGGKEQALWLALCGDTENEKSRNFVGLIDALRRASAVQRVSELVRLAYEKTAFCSLVYALGEGEKKEANLKRLLRAAEPVSYTHLDVYKRQVQLSAYAFCAQQAERAQRFGALHEFVVGAEFGWITLNVGSNHRADSIKEFFKYTAVKIGRYPFGKQRVILRSVFLAVKNPGKHRTRIHRSAGNGRINRIVYEIRSAARGLKAAERQIIVPWNHGKLSVFFIEIIVVNHRTGIAVKVADEIMHEDVYKRQPAW